MSPVSSAPPPPAEIHDFDFWLGSWEVVTPDGKLVGHNHIEAILGGRVLRENYTTPGTYAGRSFNIYNAAAQRWEQYWVDVTGLALHLTGGLNPAGQMVLQGKRVTPAGTSIVDRITWTPQADGTVRQFWETSSDGGETWAPAFDGRYRPVAPPTP
ncbi:hypothetical protein PXH66_16315 [Synoicihabitans lomoniglobus]|uniref:DUF1579 domain-containing protein n=1 Tax=Synoicihabitans lomoniglobus TaxID=2909285 RepID=A0AAF0CH56_9BACT|nr:hypothetical protein PXH66_16315 [Opitutaceae bacterium LMO-M01]